MMTTMTNKFQTTKPCYVDDVVVAAEDDGGDESEHSHRYYYLLMTMTMMTPMQQIQFEQFVRMKETLVQRS